MQLLPESIISQPNLTTMYRLKQGVMLLACFLLISTSQAQLLKKLKDKVNNAIGGNSSTSSSTGTTDNNTGTTPSGSPQNHKGGGLTNTPPPDVKEQITEAEKSQSAGTYSDARYSIQQALMSIELQIGKQVLQSLPATVTGLQKDTTQNTVMSTQWGWNNLSIQSVYKKGDQQMTVTIGNNAFYSGFVNMYFNNGMYAQTGNNGDNQNVKQTKVKGYKAVISYDDSKGYSLLVPIGQSSLMVWECVNFTNEAAVMSAANAFDIDGIKKMLGEQ